MAEMSGQFYAIYGNTYQHMSTKPMLEQAWRRGELIDQLAVTRQNLAMQDLEDQSQLLTSHHPQHLPHPTSRMAPAP